MGVSVDSVEEFKVMSSNFSAEYGRSTGGIINLSLKSGTNQFHGSGYEFLRNDAMDARGYFQSHKAAHSAKRLWDDFFGSGLDPKDLQRTMTRRFFFFSYEGFRYRDGAINNITTLPIDAFRKGDFQPTGGRQRSPDSHL